MNMKNPAVRGAGFFVALAMAALCLVTAAGYALCYGTQELYMSWIAFAVLLVCGVAGAALAFLRHCELAAACIATGSLVALLLYVQKIYLYVVVVLVGIDLSSVETRFVVSTALFAVCFIANLVAVFLPQITYADMGRAVTNEKIG